MRPNQKAGIEMPKNENAVNRLSSTEYWRTAETVPMTMAISSEKIRPAAVQDVAYPAEVALVDGLVEPDHLVQAFEIGRVLDVRLGNLGVERSARSEIQDPEKQHRGEHQGDAHLDAAAYEKSRHVEASGFSAGPTPRRSSCSRSRRTRA